MPRERIRDTRERLLDEAELLIGMWGYRDFSFKKLAKTLSIRDASVHHHFRTKDDLVIALLERHTTQVLMSVGRWLAGELTREEGSII